MSAPEVTDLRTRINGAWPTHRPQLASRIRRPAAPAAGHGTATLRNQLFQQVVQRAERTAGGAITRERVREVIDEWQQNAAPLSAVFRADEMEQAIMDELVGLGPLAKLHRDATVSDILVNGADEVWVDRFGKLEKTAVRFDDEQHLRRVIRRVVATQGRRLDEGSPCVDVRLSDGSRLNVVLTPVSLGGSTISIRRARDLPLHMEDLIAFGTLAHEMSDLLERIVRERLNVIVSGGAGTGKTTLLSALSRAIAHDERVVTIEETAELRLEHPHVVSLETRTANVEGAGTVDMRQLVRNALRMRADRIIVGEVRGAEAFEMLQAMHVGHEGSLTTIHANSSEDALRRLVTLVSASGVELPSTAVREVITSVIDVVVQMTRGSDGTRRVEAISAVDKSDSSFHVTDLYRFDRTAVRFVPGPELSQFENRLSLRRQKG